MDEPQRTWSGHVFALTGAIDALRDSAGHVLERMPQDRYEKTSSSRLNRHGSGPFADLVLPHLPSSPGLYVVTVDNLPMYVGIAEDLAERWGPRGYSRIHPRNCFVGGQSTNCTINAAILRELRKGVSPQLWILVTTGQRSIERTLIAALKPAWNSAS